MHVEKNKTHVMFGALLAEVADVGCALVGLVGQGLEGSSSGCLSRQNTYVTTYPMFSVALENTTVHR